MLKKKADLEITFETIEVKEKKEWAILIKGFAKKSQADGIKEVLTISLNNLANIVAKKWKKEGKNEPAKTGMCIKNR